jgi:hypothetical protein
MTTNKRTYRMYGFVNYQLSGIQKGIQFGHAVVEYGLSYGETEGYQKWANHDKTFIILNGGTTNTRKFDGRYVGSLNQHVEDLTIAGIKRSIFYEPDLGDCLTSVVFLVDDRVFDRVAWPEYDGLTYDDGTPDPTEYWEWKMKFSESEIEADKIVWLRDWLPKFRLA